MHICTYGSMSEKSIKDKAKKNPVQATGFSFVLCYQLEWWAFVTDCLN